jgi:4-hydroxybenzoate polyprenyltransferase
MERSDTAGLSQPIKPYGGLGDYLRIARFDHATKHVFIVPGIVTAYLLRGLQNREIGLVIILGLIAAVSIASANYVINEWLDRDFDKFHPTKSARVSVQRELDRNIVIAEWLGLIAIGLIAAALASKLMLIVASIFVLQGVFYNIPPFRTKDKPYLDVISESINNPLRLLIGWAMIDSGTLPPASLIAAYWCGGAFLMAAKRFSEYREIVAINGRDLLIRYRASFGGYTEASLNVSCLIYALLSAFFLTVFLIKYRIEYVLTMPFIALLFGQYLSMAMQPGSTAQKPENLFQERNLIFTVWALIVVFLCTTFVNMPELTVLLDERFITLR